MTDEHDFEAEARGEDEIAALKRSLLRVYAASMARGRVDEARKTLQVLTRYLPEPPEKNADHPAVAELEGVIGHLGHLAEPGTPATELARLASEKLLNYEAGIKPTI